MKDFLSAEKSNIGEGLCAHIEHIFEAKKQLRVERIDIFSYSLKRLDTHSVPHNFKKILYLYNVVVDNLKNRKFDRRKIRIESSGIFICFYSEVLVFVYFYCCLAFVFY